MTRFLVIGASSFTGRAFCEYAERKGDEVAKASLRDWDWDVGVQQYVVNFAAANVVAPSWDWAQSYMNTNVQIALWNKLRLRGNIKRYVHISTPEVYGSTNGMVKEDAPYNPSTPYAVSRASAEMMLKCYFKQYQFPVIFTRSCNVYGPGQQLYRLIPKLIVSIKKGIKFRLEGGGRSLRSFLHVKDACAAIYQLCEKGTLGEAYHISTVATLGIRGLVDMVCNRMGVKFEDVVEEVPDRPGKDQQYMLDSTKIRKLGWNDTVWIDDGINEVIAWVERDWDILKDLPMEYVHRP